MKFERKIPSYIKRAKKDGLFLGFIYLLVFMSIFTLAIWQTFESRYNSASIGIIDERLSIIEEEINIVDETNNDSLTDLSSSIQFLDKEVRKLWDLSNKRNKVNIQKLSSEIQSTQNLIQALELNLKENKEKMLVIAEALELNSNKINDLGLTSNDLINLKRDVTTINTQIMLLDDSINALNSYKNQLNQVILEIQTKVSNLSVDDLEIVEIN